jgi:hypothetical protein
MVKKLKSLLSVFGASGKRYKFSLFSFDKISGIEDAFPDEGAVFLFARRAYDVLRFRFVYKLLHCGETRDLSVLSAGRLSHAIPSLLAADCVAVLFEKDASVRSGVVKDILKRNF